ncbi:CAP superfamily protein [Abeliophyllum distichum]|uniref:CAP superfamily protein n=1 Tax=Abeliophyllum distichum TaxID=126358 RepID=A0ABD1SWL3_9LAMI
MMAKVLLILIALSTCYCSAQVVPPPPPPPTHTTPPATALPAAAQEYLDAHNQAREEVGVGPLKWNQQLAKTASLQVRYQRDRQNCSFANLINSNYGGNQLWASGLAVTPRAVVETWVAEKKFYSYAENSCAQDHRCGVYTQVVWKKSAELGCAQAACGKEHASLTICFYNPPGNVIGEKPY